MSLSILITSAGRLTQHVISTLLSLSDCPPIRVIARSHADLGRSFPAQLRSAPHSVVIIENITDPNLANAFQGISIVLHSGPLLDPKEEASSVAIIDMAKNAGVKHFILCSVLQPVRTKLHIHKAKLNIEEYLTESRLRYTILQASDVAVNTGKIAIGFSPFVEHAFVDLNDLALTVLTIIRDPKSHSYACYELVAENISYHNIARLIAQEVRRDVQCEVLSTKDYLALMTGSYYVRNEHAEDAITRIMMYYDRWGLLGNPNVLRFLLGREPTSWTDYLRRELPTDS
ncbi:hypothetical protein M422DRAFT_271199 [Sphaerobolus stellatus SS14]|uniref:NmrA-like domain-containing protein n=1 Tax=Sphaerobolus stellatus (strain SS14) TaxID=990650 RepID=A0A0C9UQ99_SPHS4|nr:hypothetical protein M422DRAFT_271199 [Sphaerobolus stellatus SS14]